MAEWIVETGVGETRAALVGDGRILAARIELPGLRLGTVARARLIEPLLARLDSGAEVTLDRRPAGATLGAALTVEITREAIPEPGRTKPPRARVSDEAPRPGLTLRERLTDAPVRTLQPHQTDALEDAGWSEVREEARTGDIAFPGGMLRMWPTPAMTLFDVDGGAAGTGGLDALAIAAATAVGKAVVRHDIGGSIGIDFPTLTGKAPRHAVAAALDAALPQPFERTAVNGFGFLQIVRPRPRASLPELLRSDPIGAALRAELRRIEREPPTAPPITLPPALGRRLAEEPAWHAELVRRCGRDPISQP